MSTQQKNFMEDKIYNEIKTGLNQDPNAMEAFKDRVAKEKGISPDKVDVDAEMHTIAHDISGNISRKEIFQGGMHKISFGLYKPDGEKTYEEAYKAFDEGLKKDMPDDKLRHAIAEQAANGLTKEITGADPHRHGMKDALTQEVIADKVSASVDGVKKEISDRMHQLPGPLGEMLGGAIDRDIAVNSQAIKTTLTGALTNLAENNPNFTHQQAREAVAKAMQNDFAKDFPAYAKAVNEAKNMGLLENPLAAVLQGAAEKTVSAFVAETVADGVKPREQRSMAENALNAVEVGLHELSGISPLSIPVLGQNVVKHLG